MIYTSCSFWSNRAIINNRSRQGAWYLPQPTAVLCSLLSHQVDDHREVIDRRLLVSDFVDANLRVGHTAAVPRFDERLVLLEAVATCRSCFVGRARVRVHPSTPISSSPERFQPARRPPRKRQSSWQAKQTQDEWLESASRG